MPFVIATAPTALGLHGEAMSRDMSRFCLAVYASGAASAYAAVWVMHHGRVWPFTDDLVK